VQLNAIEYTWKIPAIIYKLWILAKSIRWFCTNTKGK
jgi:hypothetical protein